MSQASQASQASRSPPSLSARVWSALGLCVLSHPFAMSCTSCKSCPSREDGADGGDGRLRVVGGEPGRIAGRAAGGWRRTGAVASGERCVDGQ